MVELQIAAGEIVRGKDEKPVFFRDCRFAIGFYGSVEVNDSAGVFQLWDKGVAGENQFPPNAYEIRWDITTDGNNVFLLNLAIHEMPH